MGGADSEITDATTDVALEIAWFEPIGIAQTVEPHSGCAPRPRPASSAASIRTSPIAPSPGSSSCSRETCPDSSSHDAVDARSDHLAAGAAGDPVGSARSTRILGTSIPADEIVELIEPDRLRGARAAGDGVLTVDLPSWRPDSTAEIDVVEEVARHYGYERSASGAEVDHPRPASAPQQRRRVLREVLLGLGLDEAMPNPFLARRSRRGRPRRRRRCASPTRWSPTRACCAPRCGPAC